MKNFSAHIGRDWEIWSGGIGSSGLTDLNMTGEISLDFCASHDFSVKPSLLVTVMTATGNPVVDTSCEGGWQVEERDFWVHFWDLQTGTNK